jgi:hypothetical protein
MTRKKLVRSQDALDCLRWADEAGPNKKLRQTYLEMALFEYQAGKLNARFGAKEDRRAGCKRIDDSKAKALMLKIAAETGETRPYTLARLAVESGELDLRGAEPATVIRRLVRVDK